MHRVENRERVLTFMVSKGLCSREYAESWYEHEQIPAFDMETPEHIVRSGQVNALLDYLEAAMLEQQLKPEGEPDEEEYQVIVRGESLGMNNPDKNS
ncbi:hypothetical protein MD588_07915 [Photobacterium sp. SDRW27]|uniref:hypothetical protein n=1 Tax=Photobacterium obscurum TaxID=2829490 RepID=UPI00224462A0|nr:hypothetical protein [Photobacterium obscurum]MCW8328733.1 hypothetical protein [Photobacterium obscurum]